MPKKDAHISIIKNTCNRGLLHSRIIGGKCARGVYIIYVDSDDYIATHTCKICYEFAQQYNADILAFGTVCEGFSRRAYSAKKMGNVCDKFALLFPNARSFTPYVWNKCYARTLLMCG